MRLLLFLAMSCASQSTAIAGSFSDANSKKRDPPKRDANTNTTATNSSKSNDTKSLTEKVLRNYRDEILQVNFLNSKRYNNTLYKADLFAINQDVFGYEWKNGIFMRLPFPTFSQVSQRFADIGEKPKMIMPLYNRFAPRPARLTQMDCPIHVGILRNTHYNNRFTKIHLRFTSPCHRETFEKVILQKCGLRQFLKLRFKEHEFVIAFRSIRPMRLSANRTAERYTEYKFLAPTHHHINYRSKLYMDDHRQNPDQGRRITPQMRLSNQLQILSDMNTYYKKSLKLVNLAHGNKNLTIPTKEIGPNYAQGEGIFSPTPQQIQRDQNDQRYQWGMGHHEINQIYHRLSWITSTYREVFTMCKKICTAQDYYYSWRFCKQMCSVEDQFLSNDASMQLHSQLFQNLDWVPMRKRNEPMPRKDAKRPFWLLSDIEDLWAGKRVVNCQQTWTTIICDI